jgi:hypothetical protein
MKQIFLMLGIGMFVMSCHKKDSDPAPAPILNFNVTTLSLPPVPGASADLIVESNIDWQASLSNGADWLQLSKTTGHGNDTLHITVIKDNQNAEARTATVTATPVNSGIDLQMQATITQKPYNVQLLSQKTFGGSGADNITDVVTTADGGLFMTGVTRSNNSGIVGANHGTSDAWMIRLNSNRDTVWTRVMGGIKNDAGAKAIALADGSFVVAGNTDNNKDGDVIGSNGLSDWWIIKLKSNGDTAWTRTVGGAYNDNAYNIAATADGGFVVVGTYSASNLSFADAMAVKFNSNGDIIWKKTYGGSNLDLPTSVCVSPAGAIYIAVWTQSNNTGDVGNNNGLWDYAVLKLTANGEKEWMKLYGGAGQDTPLGIANTADGGVIVTGTSASNGTGNVGTSHGLDDLWVIKLNTNGDIVWNSLLGGTGSERGQYVEATPDGGFLITGFSESKDGDVGVNQGKSDLWVLKLSNTGKILWNKTYGGAGTEFSNKLLLNSDGSFYIVGYTDSSGSGDTDGWLLKLTDY